MAALDFTESALFQWFSKLQAHLGGKLTLETLSDGVALCAVLAEMAPDYFTEVLQQIKEDARDDERKRRHNLNAVMGALSAFYQDGLGQVILFQLPRLSVIAKEPASESGVSGLKTILLLVLGCAVQCDHRERYINQIKTLDNVLQMQLMAHIQETMGMLLRVPLDELDAASSEDLISLVRLLFEHLTTAVAQRDKFAQQLGDAIDRERNMGPLGDISFCGATPNKRSSVLDTSAVGVDLTKELRSQMRSLTLELDQKQAIIDQFIAEDERNKTKLAQQAIQLRELGTLADAYRNIQDEVDVWRNKASETDRMQGEVTRLRERLEDLDAFKARAESLSQENSRLRAQGGDVKSLTEALETLRQQYAERDREARGFEIQHKELTAMMDSHFAKNQTLASDKFRLESELIHTRKELERLRSEIESRQNADMGPSIMSELHAADGSHVAEIELLHEEIAHLSSAAAEAETLRRECEDSRRSNAALSAHLSEEQLKNADLQSVQVRLQRNIAELQSEVKRLSSMATVEDLDTLRRSVSQKDALLAAAEERQKMLAADVVRLKEEVQRARTAASAATAAANAATAAAAAAAATPAPATRALRPGAGPSRTSVMEELDAAARLAKELESARQDAANQSAKHVKALQKISELQRQLESRQVGAAADRRLEEQNFMLERKVAEAAHQNELMRGEMKERIQLAHQKGDALEKENTHLVAQMQKLLLQNHELLSKAVESNDRWKLSQDQIEALRREKDAIEIEMMKRKPKKTLLARLGLSRPSKDGDSTSLRSASTPDLARRHMSMSAVPAPGSGPSARAHGPPPPNTPGNESISLEQMLLEGHIAAAREGIFVKTPAHPPRPGPQENGAALLDHLLFEGGVVKRRAPDANKAHRNSRYLGLEEPASPDGPRITLSDDVSVV